MHGKTSSGTNSKGFESPSGAAAAGDIYSDANRNLYLGRRFRGALDDC